MSTMLKVGIPVYTEREWKGKSVQAREIIRIATEAVLRQSAQNVIHQYLDTGWGHSLAQKNLYYYYRNMVKNLEPEAIHSMYEAIEELPPDILTFRGTVSQYF